MSETKSAAEALPIIEPHDFNEQNLARSVPRLYDVSDVPGLVVSHIPEVTPDWQNRHVGAMTLRAVKHSYGDGYGRFEERVIKRYVATPEHLDGVLVNPYLQLHTNRGPARAQIDFTVRELDKAAQQELAATPIDEHPLMRQAPYRFAMEIIDDLPEDSKRFSPAAVRFAPIVARYRTFLDPGDTLVFRNGFNMLAPTEEPKRIVTHRFHSVDENDELVTDLNNPELGRNIDVSFIAPLAKQVETEKRRRGLFGRKK